MQYDLGPRVHMTPRIMQILADLWMNRVTSYPLYVVSLVRTHIYAGYFVSLLDQAHDQPSTLNFIIPIIFY
jgi:hypothetical protein